MSAGQTVAAALHAMQGAVGEMCLAIEKKQSLPKHLIFRWVKRLRGRAVQVLGRS